MLYWLTKKNKSGETSLTSSKKEALPRVPRVSMETLYVCFWQKRHDLQYMKDY